MTWSDSESERTTCVCTRLVGPRHVEKNTCRDGDAGRSIFLCPGVGGPNGMHSFIPHAGRQSRLPLQVLLAHPIPSPSASPSLLLFVVVVGAAAFFRGRPGLRYILRLRWPLRAVQLSRRCSYVMESPCSCLLCRGC